MPVINRIADFHDEMKEWRQHIHANPELLFDTFKTSAFVEERLKEFGVDHIKTGVGRTGVVGIIKGNGGDGPTIGLRADMDALPIQEVRDLPYKSQNPGVMHACGHDGHTTMLLGAARYLAETRNFSGSVALIFQPAEEGGGGGREMVEDGIMDEFGIEQVYGIHNWPNNPLGQFATRPGPLMAAADTFEVHITGNGAHAARPHLGIDPVMVAVQIAQGFQTLVSRRLDPMEHLVISITQIHAGTTNNVIPETAYLNGTVRTLRKGHNLEIRDQMRRIAELTAEAHEAKAELSYEIGYPVTSNDGAKVDFAVDVARDVVGAELVDGDTVGVMGSEDFSYMLEARPGAYLFLGQGESAGLHNENYDFNDEVSPIGASFFARLVETAQPPRR